jgi:hypothetical protein
LGPADRSVSARPPLLFRLAHAREPDTKAGIRRLPISTVGSIPAPGRSCGASGAVLSLDSLKGRMERDIMSELLAWGAKLPGFGREHARHGIRLARCIVDGVEDRNGNFIPGIGAHHPDGLFDLALDIAWIFWLDDCFDSNPEQSSNRLLVLADFEDSADDAPLEVWSAAAVRAGMRSVSSKSSDAEGILWMDSVVAMTKAFQRNKRSSRSGVDWTFAEYLDNGEQSSAVPHFLATVSMLYGLDLPQRMTDPSFTRIIRHLSLEMRLENDLVSCEKEMDEGDNANVTMIMMRFMPREDVFEFIEEQRSGYERMVLDDLEELMPDDRLGRVMRLVLEGAHWFHNSTQDRYSRPIPAALDR